MIEMKFWILLIYIVVSCMGTLFLKVSTNYPKLFIFMNYNVTLPLIISVLLYGAGFILFTIVLKNFDVSYVYPIATSVSIVLITVSGVIVFGEKLTIMHFLGIALIVIGVILINIKGVNSL